MNFKTNTKIYVLFILIIFVHIIFRLCPLMLYDRYRGVTFYLPEEDVLIRLQYHVYSRPEQNFTLDITIAEKAAYMNDTTKTTRYHYFNDKRGTYKEELFFDKLRDTTTGKTYYSPVLRENRADKVCLDYNNYKYPLRFMTSQERDKKYSKSHQKALENNYTYYTIQSTLHFMILWPMVKDKNDPILVDIKSCRQPRRIINPKYYFK